MTVISQSIPMVFPKELPSTKKVEVLHHPTKVLNEMKSVLEKRKKKALGLIKEYKRDLRQTSKGENLEERTHQTKEELTSVLEHQQMNAVEIQLALDRISTGEYGICTKTKQLIPLQRLLACPTATTCV